MLKLATYKFIMHIQTLGIYHKNFEKYNNFWDIIGSGNHTALDQTGDKPLHGPMITQ